MKFQRLWGSVKLMWAKERVGPEDTKGRKAISGKVRRDVWKNKDLPIVQISFLGKEESLLIDLFLLQALLSK